MLETYTEREELDPIVDRVMEAAAGNDKADELFPDAGSDEEEFLAQSLDKLTTIDFKTSHEMMLYYDTALNKGDAMLHKWQVETNILLSTKECDAKNYFKYYLVAVNGSGKDKFLIAPLAVWEILSHKKSRVVITSSSGNQLTGQTENYIRAMCQTINEYEKIVNNIPEVFKVNQRYIRCNLSGSEIRMFATDDKGKAEGYHPMETNSRMVLIVNEAKTVKDEIFEALTRCTGYCLWLEVSSPGEAQGHFYKMFTGAAAEHKRTVTAYDCSHFGPQHYEDLKTEYGEGSALYNSMVWGYFSSIGGYSVIKKETIDKWLKAGVQDATFQEWQTRIGLDLAAGGDENGMCAIKGNKVIHKTFFREVDTTITADIINKTLLSWQIPKNSDYIFADDGGVGHAIIDMLRRMGWNIQRKNNQSAAFNKREYGNLGAENWYRVNRIIEEGVFDLTSIGDAKLLEQLSSRYYNQGQTTGRIMLESKSDAKAHGRPSPDRADAFVLCFCGLTVGDYLKDGGLTTQARKTITQEELTKIKHLALSNDGVDQEWYEQMYPQVFGKTAQEVFDWERSQYNEAITNNKRLKRVHGSIEAALSNN